MKFPTAYVKLAKKDMKVFNPGEAKNMEFGKAYLVPLAPYWRRRIRAGEITFCDEKGKKAEKEMPPVPEKEPPPRRSGAGPRRLKNTPPPSSKEED